MQILPAPGNVQWEEVNTDPAGHNAVDPASIQRTGDTARFIMRVIFHPGRYPGIHHLVARLTYDCRAQTFTIEASDFYDENGRLVDAREIPPGERRARPMNLVQGYEAMHARICGAEAA